MFFGVPVQSLRAAAVAYDDLPPRSLHMGVNGWDMTKGYSLPYAIEGTQTDNDVSPE